MAGLSHLVLQPICIWLSFCWEDYFKLRCDSSAVFFIVDFWTSVSCMFAMHTAIISKHSLFCLGPLNVCKGTACISYFSCHCDKTYGKLGKERLIFAHSLRDHSHHAGESTWQESEEAGYTTSTVRNQRDGHWCSACSFLFSLGPTYRTGLPTTVNPVWKLPKNMSSWWYVLAS